MRIYCSSLTDIIKSVEGKRFLPEVVSQKKCSKLNLKNLIPVRDIDDEFVSYSTKKIPQNIGATSYDDIFEHMSFEEPRIDEKNTFRLNELFNKRNESSRTLITTYDKNDLPLSNSIMDSLYSGQNKIDKFYYPDTDLTEQEAKAMKLLDFIENIVPSSMDRRLNLEYKTVREFAKYATDSLLEDGIPTPEIRKILSKSVLTSSGGAPLGAEPELFEFLTRYPKERNLVVKRNKDGNEFFDKTAAMYLKSFDTKYFNSSDTARKVLEECKSYSPVTGYKMVDRSLCNIATMLRRKTAQGLETMEESRYYWGEPRVHYCERSYPWSKADSALIERLKPDGFLDENAYGAAKFLLSKGNTVENVTKYIEPFLDKQKEYSLLLKKLEKYNCQPYQKSNLESILSAALAHSQSSLENLTKPNLIFTTAKKMMAKSYSVPDINYVLKSINGSFKTLVELEPKSFDSILQASTVTKPKLNTVKLSHSIFDMFEKIVSSKGLYSPSISKFTKALENKNVKSSLDSHLKSECFSTQALFEENFVSLSRYIDRLSDYYKNNNAGHLAK